MRNKVLDLRTERGKKIIAEIIRFYPSVAYGIRDSKQIMFAEGYTHVIIDDKNIVICK